MELEITFTDGIKDYSTITKVEENNIKRTYLRQSINKNIQRRKRIRKKT